MKIPGYAAGQKGTYAFDSDGKLTEMKQYQLRDGIFEAILDRFYKDPSLVAFGEENRDWGGAFAVTVTHEACPIIVSSTPRF